MVVCEATGGYEKKIVNACHQANIPVHLAHANKVRYFAKSKGLLAKTDKLDAKVLSEYGRVFEPQADTVLLNKTTAEMQDLLKRREQLQAFKRQDENRLDRITNKKNKRSIKAHIKWLDKEIKKMEEEIQLLQKSDEVKFDHQLLKSIPAIGDLSACYLLSFLPELGKLSNKQLSALVGVAPFNRDSGEVRGKRFIQGGRGGLRKVLYMCAISAIRCHPDLKKFYLRLKTKGKATRVALVAVMRKLICMANSVLTRGTAWQKELVRT